MRERDSGEPAQVGVQRQHDSSADRLMSTPILASFGLCAASFSAKTVGP
jgi:hypothetical protein